LYIFYTPFLTIIMRKKKKELNINLDTPKRLIKASDTSLLAELVFEYQGKIHTFQEKLMEYRDIDIDEVNKSIKLIVELSTKVNELLSRIYILPKADEFPEDVLNKRADEIYNNYARVHNLDDYDESIHGVITDAIFTGYDESLRFNKLK
jgi:hypothetical protein